MRRSGRCARLLARFRRVRLRQTRCNWSRFHTVMFFSGSLMSRATPLMNFSSECEPAIARIAAAVAVGVDVDGGVLLQLVGVLLGPFGRAQQPWLLRRPTRNR